MGDPEEDVERTNKGAHSAMNRTEGGEAAPASPPHTWKGHSAMARLARPRAPLHQAAGGERREGERGVSDTHGGAVRFGELEVERVAREVPLHSKEGKSVISRGVEMRAEWERRRTMSMPPILLSTASLPLAASDSGSSYVMTTLRDLLYRNGCNAGESESASTRFAKVRAERQRASTHRGRARVPLARVAVGADVIDLGRARVLDDDAVVDQVDKLDLVALEARQVTRADLARTVTRLEDAVASASRAATSRVAARERVPVNLGDVLARDAGAGLARVVVGAHDDVALGEDVACGLALGALGRAACATASLGLGLAVEVPAVPLGHVALVAAHVGEVAVRQALRRDLVAFVDERGRR